MVDCKLHDTNRSFSPRVAKEFRTVVLRNITIRYWLSTSGQPLLQMRASMKRFLSLSTRLRNARPPPYWANVSVGQFFEGTSCHFGTCSFCTSPSRPRLREASWVLRNCLGVAVSVSAPESTPLNFAVHSKALRHQGAEMPEHL